MKQAIKKMAIEFTKKIGGAIYSALAMLIGELIIGAVTKRFVSFKTARINKKNNQTETKTEPTIECDDDIKIEDILDKNNEESKTEEQA